MSDEEFYDIDFDEPRDLAIRNETAFVDNLENEHERINESQRMQKLLGNLENQNPKNNIIDHMEYRDPANKFEELLKELGVKIGFDEEIQTRVVVLAQNMNHDQMTTILETKMLKNQGSNVIFDEFADACRIPEMMEMYLAPTKSTFGQQDTVFRAFLIAQPSQTKTFELLLEKLNKLARSSEEHEIQLAHSCVAHMRYLGRLFEPTSVFNIVFETPFHLWNADVRNGLINALPEIFTDFGLQQDAALRLNDMLQEKNDEILDLQSFQFIIIETLKLLRMESSIGRQIRKSLIMQIMQFGPMTIPSVVSFSLAVLLIGQNTLKNDEEEIIFHDVLRDFSKHLKIDQIRAGVGRNSSPDHIVTAIYEHFLRYLQLDKKAWKHVGSYLSNSESRLVKEEEDENDKTNWMNTFDIMLIFSLMSSDSCPSNVISAINSKILSLPSISASTCSKFLKLIDMIINFKRFSTAHLSSLIHVARQCLWSSDSNVRSLGVSVYKQLFVGMEKANRKAVFEELMKHFNQSETECESVLDILLKVVKSNFDVIMEFSNDIQGCIESIHTLSISNTKKLFQVMLTMTAKKNQANKFEIDEIINRFLSSVSERERFLGVLALIMKIKMDMGKRHSEAQENEIRGSVEKIEKATKESSKLRGAFYEHMAQVVEGHKRIEEIRFLNEWLDRLLKSFREEFFEENMEESTPEEEEGGERHMVLPTTRWKLSPEIGRMVEVAPMFNLIKELLVLKIRWKDDDDDSLRSSYDITAINEIVFAFEASVDLKENDQEEAKNLKMDRLFFTSQWCRTVLNAFLGQSSIDFLHSTTVSKFGTKLFDLMMSSEKKLLHILGGVTQWPVPNLKFESKQEMILIAGNGVGGDKSGNSKRKAKKRKSDENEENEQDEQMEIGDELNETSTRTAPKENSNLAKYFVQLKLRPIVHLMKLTNKKRSCLIYLCDELLSVLKELVKNRGKKNFIPMLAARSISTSPSKIDKLYHGDSSTVWICVKKAIEEIWGIVESVFMFYSTITEESGMEISVEKQRGMEELGQKSLQLVEVIMTSELFGSDERMTSEEKDQKRNVLILIIEKKMFELPQLTTDYDKGKEEISKYLVNNAQYAASPAMALSILDVFGCLKVEDVEIRKKMAKFALAYLKKDWNRIDENFGKGAKFNGQVRDVLKHYVALRKEKDQILAIKWILTNKIVQLVPDEEKRRSCVFSQRSEDGLVENDDGGTSVFYCFNKSTFPMLFKTLFSSLNTCVCRKEMSGDAMKKELVSEEQTLSSWEDASSCFLILCLLLRVTKIRTQSVLYTAIKEGKQFLITVSKKSSFIYLMDNITKGQNFDVISKKIERILSDVQQGNRVLQSIGTYAKTQKAVHLLKKFPELRAESENCLRIFHSAMVKNECLDAFTVGLLKSRSIDGEIITQRERTPESDDD